MANLIILYEDFIASGTVSGGSYEVGLPVTNVQNQRLGVVARTTDALAASTRIDFDYGVERRTDVIVLGVPNASPGAQYRVRMYSDSGRTVVTYDSGWKDLPGVVIDSLDLEWEDPGFWYGINTEELLVEFSTWIVEVIPEASASDARQRWGRIEVLDESNADGYLDFSRLMGGRAFKPAVNYSEDNSFGLSELTDASESLGGQRSYFERGIRRTLRLALPYGNSWDEAFDSVLRMMVKARTSRQVFVIPDYEDTEFLQVRSFLATFKQVPAIQQLLVDRSSTLVDVEEVL